jgi:hypothetical protein
MRILNLPPEVTETASRQEVMRAWLDKGKLSLSLCHKFPDRYKPTIEIWAMLLSDIFHHVVDALALETKIERPIIQEQIRTFFEEVLRSNRGSRSGALKEYNERLKELPDPDVSGDDQCVEIVRIILLEDSIRVVVRVGMWLPDNEESVWGNLLYDLIYTVALSMKNDDLDEVREILAKKVLGYIEEPSTEYSGRYY